MNIDLMLAAALEYAEHHWAVFPLRGKEPFKSPHRGGSQGREHRECGGRCGHPGHGVLSATTNTETVAAWWGGRYAGANIGTRVPANMFVIDIDPRKDGCLQWLADIEAKFSPLPETLTTFSGRGDGGRHLFYRRPPGALSAARLGPGIDLKTSTGYTVAAPSIHPATRKPYRRIDRPVATPPDWLIRLLLPEPKPAPRITPRRVDRSNLTGPSIADAYSAAVSWADVLAPHGWTCSELGGGDFDGSVWLHPRHTSACSATVRNGCLFVWSTSTVFDVSEPGHPRGYTKFKAYAVLNHGGDMKAAARHLMKGAA